MNFLETTAASFLGAIASKTVEINMTMGLILVFLLLGFWWVSTGSKRRKSR